MAPNINDICQKIKINQFESSKHAVDESIVRRIKIHELKEAIACGKIIEDYPTDKYVPSCLICGATMTGRILHIQCSYPTRPQLKIITLYSPNPNLWDETFTQRKSNNV